MHACAQRKSAWWRAQRPGNLWYFHESSSQLFLFSWSPNYATFHMHAIAKGAHACHSSIEGFHEWSGQCSWYFRKSDLSKPEYRKNIFGGNSYQHSWISLYAPDESSIKHRGKKKSGPCNLGDASFSGSCRVRLDVVDLLVAQYPGTAPTRILLVGTTSTCTS